jgi:hypothetical protein
VAGILNKGYVKKNIEINMIGIVVADAHSGLGHLLKCFGKLLTEYTLQNMMEYT